MHRNPHCAAYQAGERPPRPAARARSFRVRLRTEVDIHACGAMARAMGEPGTADATIGLAMVRLRRDFRRRCHEAGIDPGTVIRRDRELRDARSRGERPLTEARRYDQAEAWRERIGANRPRVDVD